MNNDLDFLQTLVNAQRANPQNSAIFNLALNRAQGLFEDPKEQQKQQLVDMLTKAQISRYAETGDPAALDMVNTLFSSEDPLQALRSGQGNTNTAGLMQEAQMQFDKKLQPRIQQAIKSGDLETAEKLSSFTPEALRNLEESQGDIESQARNLAKRDAQSRIIGETPANILGGLENLSAITIPGSGFIRQGIENLLPKVEPTEAQRQKALRSRVSSIYDTLATQ